MAETRKCIVTIESIQGDRTENAVFHRFGDSTGYADDQGVPITVAIVELNSGEVIMVEPDKIKFDDRPVYRKAD